MRIKRANIKRLASLSALGAGALWMTAVTAEASSIVYSGVIDEKVGFGKGFARSATFAGPNGAAALLKRGKDSQSGGTSWHVAIRSRQGAYGTNFKFLASRGGISIFSADFARAFPLGENWSGAGGAAGAPPGDRAGQACAAGPISPSGGEKTASHGWVDGSFNDCFSAGSFTYFKGSDAYLLFEFTGGKLPHNLYGWAQLKVTPDPEFGAAEVTLMDWAYDTSGAQIPAGDTGTPEPSTFVLTGLAALALGAKGLRAWRKAKLAV
jgi:hypothetical protein